MEIVLAEDEPNLRTTLRYAFSRENWQVRDFADGMAAWEYLSLAAPEPAGRVVVADITMPRMDGLELCRRVRSIDATVPWLFLSSRDEEFDRVLGLEIGADDYLCKPFSLRELLARIKVLHRRANPVAPRIPALVGEPLPLAHASLQHGNLVMDQEAWRAWWAGQEIILTVSEFRILASLAAQPGVVKTREQLQLAAYPEDHYINDRSVDCHIKRLRRKLSGGPEAEQTIATVYGLGYRFRP